MWCASVAHPRESKRERMLCVHGRAFSLLSHSHADSCDCSGSNLARPRVGTRAESPHSASFLRVTSAWNCGTCGDDSGDSDSGRLSAAERLSLLAAG